MTIQSIGEFLTEYISRIVILDENEEVIWTSKSAEKIYNQRKIMQHKLNDLFSITLSEIMNKNKIVKTPYGKKYSMKAREMYIADNKYFFVLIEDLEDFTNEKTMLYCLKKILESINDGVIMSDSEGRIILYNEAQEKLEDLSAEKIVGKYLWEAYNYKAVEMSEHQKVYKTGIPIVNKYKAHAYSDGVPKYLSYSTYPIEKDGEIIAVYSVSENETMLKSLLSETIELKRKLLSKAKSKEPEKNNGTTYGFADIVGDSQQMQRVIKEAQTIALLESNLLIVGETGTGKEVFAQSIHNLGKNSEEPFVAINCAAIPENLLESILFGTTKGSYTGAVDQVGLFKEAKRGTLFLDELNSMPITMQTKLLRVLQERRVRRVGGLATEPIYCRVICAVNEDPQEIIKQGKLRQDLFFRIASFCLYIPPLRERARDILSLSSYFIDKFNTILSKRVEGFSRELNDVMLSYSWPGNVRELENAIENLMIRVGEREKKLRIEHLPHYIKTTIIGENASRIIRKKESSLPETLRDIEKRIIIESLDKNEWNISKTSRDLGIIRQSLLYRMKKLDIN
ncbi:sigma 54-interacting transcriptional regulator [Wukongibacter baidiensis]|uniref:sigma-54 interaction domain-containing protein n=1 Tax=Wukongibacter baidiensis TaxID=1723361 RepID=UPI003D7FA22D